MKRSAEIFLAVLVIAAGIFILPRAPFAFVQVVLGALLLVGGIKAMRGERRP